MWRWMGYLGGGFVVVAVVVLALQLASLRTGWEPGVSAIRRFNRRFMNRRQMKTAGQPGAYAAVIRHVGRNTGTPYETPVGVVDTDQGPAIALPYGTSPDWLKNVLAAGSAELVHEGRTLQVDNPELVAASEVNAHTSAGDRFLQRLYGVDLALRLQKAETRVEG